MLLSYTIDFLLYYYTILFYSIIILLTIDCFHIEVDHKQKILSLPFWGPAYGRNGLLFNNLQYPQNLQQACGSTKGHQGILFDQDDLMVMGRFKEALFHTAQVILHLSHVLSLMTETGRNCGMVVILSWSSSVWSLDVGNRKGDICQPPHNEPMKCSERQGMCETEQKVTF